MSKIIKEKKIENYTISLVRNSDKSFFIRVHELNIDNNKNEFVCSQWEDREPAAKYYFEQEICFVNRIISER